MKQDKHPGYMPIRHAAPTKNQEKSLSIILPFPRGLESGVTGVCVSSVAVRTVLEVAGLGRRLPETCFEMQNAIHSIRKMGKRLSDFRGINADAELALQDWYHQFTVAREAYELERQGDLIPAQLYEEMPKPVDCQLELERHELEEDHLDPRFMVEQALLTIYEVLNGGRLGNGVRKRRRLEDIAESMEEWMQAY